MTKRSTALTAAAGEHFVAYALSTRGFAVAATRGGVPTVDLVVGDPAGLSSALIQVKTSSYAWRSYKKKPENDRWEWDVGEKARHLSNPSLLYAFVDLRGAKQDHPSILPDVFIVPSRIVAASLGPGWSRYMFWINKLQKNEFHERWDLL
ncbi:MAG: hypothetical protein HY791_15845 [Deltaproteobacteria bacterium]|nr:hypothetical protein [Deltaproteobacteria bacterium]